jgi:mRNA interferase RelE/StbE
LAWTIELTGTAAKQLAKMDRQNARRITDFLQQRVAPSDNPRSTGKALNGLMGALWRYRVGDCRVICDIQDQRLRVLVVMVGNRREVYR